MRTLKPMLLALSLTLPVAIAQAAEPAKAPTPSQNATAPDASRGAHLGVAVNSVPPPLAAQLPADVPRGQGLMVLRVQPGSPAAKAGLQPYDVLLSYDDQRLFSPEQLARLVANDQPGRQVHLKVVRGGQAKDVTVTLAKGAPRMARPYSPMRAPWAGAVPQMPRLHRPTPPSASGRAAPIVREVFESLAVERLPDGRYRAAIKYKGPDGKSQSFKFEGSREEIQQQIRESKELPTPARHQLLNAIGMADRPPFPEFGRPLNFDELMRLWQRGGWAQ